MQSVIIPIVPQWGLTSCSVSTPDDGFLYIGSKTINYISKIAGDDQSPAFKVFQTRQKIKSIDCDPDWSETKYFAALAEDNTIQIWDFDQDKPVVGHKAHIKAIRDDGTHPPPTKVQFCFLKNRNVLSMDQNVIVRYCVASNTYLKTPQIIPQKHEISIVKGSPYDENVIAVGTTRGLVLLASLSTQTILYTLRGHDGLVSSLGWMKVQVPPVAAAKKPEKAAKKPSNFNFNAAASDDIFDIYDYDYLENEFGAPPNTTNWKSDDESFVGTEKPQEREVNVNFNFVEACENLKGEIKALNDKDDDYGEPSEKRCNEDQQVTLKDCQETERIHGNSSISCESNNSMEMINRSTDDETTTEDHHVVHKADVHRQAECSEGAVSPVPVEVEKPKDSSEIVFLASGSQEGVIWIWNTSTGGSAAKIQLKSGHNPHSNNNNELVWINPTTLLTHTKSGELQLWTCTPDGGKLQFKQDPRKFPSHRGVVAICALRSTTAFWTISSYREIACESIVEKKVLAKYSCASTNISAIRERRDDMNKIAFACADRRIGVVNISNMTPTNVFIENYTSKIESAVISLAWSPDDQYLAFGTIEGRIGIIDTDKPTNSTFVLNPFCGKPIYSIEWKGNYIYVCCYERIAIYDGNRKNKDPHILDIVDASAISVKDNYLLVGTQSGYLQLYEKSPKSDYDYKRVSSVYIASKYISEINWSPIQPARFAVASMTDKIAILQLTDDGDMKIERVLSMGDCKSGNVCIKWSNRNENYLLSCSVDGSVCVWDLKKDGDEMIFMKQFPCPMLCGLFSPIDDNVIICAGKGTSIEMFDMRTDENAIKSPKSLKKKEKKDKHFSLQWATKVSDGIVSASKKRKNRALRVRANVGNAGIEKATDEVAGLMENLAIEKAAEKDDKETQIETSAGEGSSFLKPSLRMFHLIAKENNKDTLKHLKQVLEPADNETMKKVLSRKLFGSRKDVEELLNEELVNHQHSSTNSIANILIPQLSGDLKDEILKCIQNKKLTEWHVSLAPTVSYDFWQKCCRAYSNQLLEQGLILQASTYLLALHDTREIFENLLQKNFYQEAWVVAKLYRQPDDPIFENILEKWVAYLTLSGHFEGAAFVCALSGKLVKCQEILSKRREPTDEHNEILNLLAQKISEKCEESK